MDGGAEIKMRNAKLWCGAKNNEAPRSFEYMVFTKDGNPVNPLNLQNPLNLFRTQSRGGGTPHGLTLITSHWKLLIPRH